MEYVILVIFIEERLYSIVIEENSILACITVLYNTILICDLIEVLVS